VLDFLGDEEFFEMAAQVEQDHAHDELHRNDP